MMNTSLLVSMLRKGSNGNEILQILDTITSNPAESMMQTVQAVGDTIAAAVESKELVTASYSHQPTAEWVDF